MKTAIRPQNSLARSSGSLIPDKYRLFLFALPFLLLILVFSYFPLYGWLYAFYNYRPGFSLFDTDFVGLQWFKSIVSNPTQTKEVMRVMRNTLAMSLLGILTSICPVIFAIFLTEIKMNWYKKTVQILTTLPNFISGSCLHGYMSELEGGHS